MQISIEDIILITALAATFLIAGIFFLSYITLYNQLINRITQELPNNTIKHADASDLTIILSYGEAGIDIAISDNGKGFSMDTVQQDGAGLGIRTLYNRAKMIGRATLHLDSKEGKGT